MTKNTGTQYEIIAQIIFEAILNATEVKTIDVRRDVQIRGKDTTHQIDVYWEFQLGGITYFTVVEVKDWSSAVTKGELLKFKAVLNDLPNQARGVFVTRTGYQKGALEIARANGIMLYELKGPTEQDKKGRLRTVVLNMFACVPHTSGIRFEYDTDWMIQEGIRLGLEEIPAMRLSLEPTETVLYDCEGNAAINVKHLTDSFYPAGFDELPPTKMIQRFEKPMFMRTGLSEFPKIRISGLEAIISVRRIEETITLDADDFVGFILRDILENTERIFDKKGNPLM